MKIWRFYIKPEENTNKKSYDLYALTNNKEIAKIFMETRNMKRFLVKCTKEESDVYAVLANDSQDNILGFHDLVTKEELKNGFYRRTNITVVCTEYEYLTATNEYQVDATFSNEGYWIDSPSPKLFNEKIQEALTNILYTDIRKIYTNDPTLDSYASPDFWID